jgi:hypothetical protein
MKGLRLTVQKIFFIFLGITLWLWACLSFFWGSTYKLTSGISNLNVRFVTFDTDSSALLNDPITQQANYLASLPSSVTHLGWEVRSASNYPNGLADVQREVLHQECWAFVVVNANATSAWRTAVRNGDGSYDPNGAIGIYYMGARFYQVQYLYTESLVSTQSGRARKGSGDADLPDQRGTFESLIDSPRGGSSSVQHLRGQQRWSYSRRRSLASNSRRCVRI